MVKTLENQILTPEVFEALDLKRLKQFTDFIGQETPKIPFDHLPSRNKNKVLSSSFIIRILLQLFCS